MTDHIEVNEEQVLTAVEHEITDNLENLLEVLPPHIVESLSSVSDSGDNGALIEIVLDLGRRAEARFDAGEQYLSEAEVTREDLAYVAERIGQFGDDNRAGIERTLHRISAIRSRSGDIVGLTCRIGRAVYGTIGILRDLVESGESILLLGRPGVGKTTMLRETARVLADDLRKRVVVVDTSNEIAGDGDIPHPAIGRARRMQVPTPALQHSVMIEAVENHMPEVIVIDEIGTELEAMAARTIAERGVQLIGTAHGNTLENLMMNPTLSDLIGGIQSVTLSDEEARRRGTQKSILERKAPPTFSVMVEIQARDRVALYSDVAESVDSILRGTNVKVEIRDRQADGTVNVTEGNIYPAHSNEQEQPKKTGKIERRPKGRNEEVVVPPQAVFGGGRGTVDKPARIYPFGVSRNRLEGSIQQLGIPATIVRDHQSADAIITLKNYYRQRPKTLREAESSGLPVFVLRSNTATQMTNLLRSLFTESVFYNEREAGDENGSAWDDEVVPEDQVAAAMFEAETAIHEVLSGTSRSVELRPQVSRVRRLQHELADRYNVPTRSRGREPHRHVEVVNRDEAH